MNILHYSLGFPPYRSGGLTKYCIDLIKEQVKLGHKVALLWPGKIKNFDDDKCYFKCKKKKIEFNIYCTSIELINPLPIPLLDGINNIENFMKKKDIKIFVEFLDKMEIDVLHIHTLMGLPMQLVEAANKKGIKIIYTSHDCFGLCPKASFVCNNEICDGNDYNKCIECNRNALSLNKIKFLQTDFYKIIKNLPFLRTIRKNHNLRRNTIISDKFIIKEDERKSKSKEYEILRKYYVEMLEKMDTIHFNSEKTKEIFSKYLMNKESDKVISITNSFIKDNRRIIKVAEKIVKFGYMGPVFSIRKGFFDLIEVFDEIYNLGIVNFELHVFKEIGDYRPYIKCHKPYNTLDGVFDEVNISIIPSMGIETFGFSVIESLSYGVPVIVSENVGAKDLINEKNGFIYENKESLKKIIEYCLKNVDYINWLNENIINLEKIKMMEDHVNEIIELYK